MSIFSKKLKPSKSKNPGPFSAFLRPWMLSELDPPYNSGEVRRTLLRCKSPLTVDSSSEHSTEPEMEKVEDILDANLITSRVEGFEEVDVWDSSQKREWHAPCLDLDHVPIRIIESSTLGHCHLYIDKVMEWDHYEKLLNVLGEVGILEPGYVKASIAQKQTMLRVRPSKNIYGGEEIEPPELPRATTVDPLNGMTFYERQGSPVYERVAEDLEQMLEDLGPDPAPTPPKDPKSPGGY